MSSIQTLLVPVDFSETSSEALTYASRLARDFGASLHVVHCYEAPLAEVTPYHFAVPERVWDDLRDAARAQLFEVKEKLAAGGVDVQAHLREGSPAETIARSAEQLGADLIVMGTHGHTGLKHALLGSVAERTLRLAPCPVLTVKSQR